MAKTTRVNLDRYISIFKALLPILLGIIFIAFLAFISYSYQKRDQLNLYSIITEHRQELTSQYKYEYANFETELDSALNLDRNSVVQEELERLSVKNQKLETDVLEIQKTISQLESLGVEDHDELIAAYVLLDSRRLELHQQVENFINQQKAALQYKILRADTEGCLASLDLTSNQYLAVEKKIGDCLAKLGTEIKFVQQISDSSRDYPLTLKYLDAHKQYLLSLRKVYAFLNNQSSVEAKNESSKAQKHLATANGLLTESEKELNTLFSQDLIGNLKIVVEDLKKMEDTVLELESFL